MFYVKSNLNNKKCKYVSGCLHYSSGDVCFNKHREDIEMSTLYSLFEKQIDRYKNTINCTCNLPISASNEDMDICVKDCVETLRHVLEKDMDKLLIRHKVQMKGLDNVYVSTV